MTVTPRNDFVRPAPRVRKAMRLVQASLASVVVLAAGHTVIDVGTPNVLDLLRATISPVGCAAMLDDPCEGVAPRSTKRFDSRQPATRDGSREQGSGLDRPTFDGELLRFPEGYQRWRLIGSSVGLGYAEAASGHEMFHHVYLSPPADAEFARSGRFPEGTMLALEIREPASRVPPAKAGAFAGPRAAVEFAVKDSSRFREGWAYFDLGDGRPTAPAQPAGRCESCHREHAATDHVFTQFYSGLLRPTGGAKTERRN